MTTTEFSNEFDILYNSITSNQAPGIDEYEKSVFLTKAQSEIIKEYFNSRVDGANGGFDGSQKRQYDFSQLITTKEIEAIDEKNLKDDNKLYHICNDSLIFELPKDYFLIINEAIKEVITISSTDSNTDSSTTSTIQYSVIGISYSDYQRLMQKPYPYPPKKSMWRLITNNNVDITPKDNIGEEKIMSKVLIEIIGKFKDSKNSDKKYVLRYIKKPSPIILVNIGDLTIDDLSEETPCDLPEQLHKEILERAVTLAKIAYQGGSTSTLAQQQSRNNQQQ